MESSFDFFFFFTYARESWNSWKRRVNGRGTVYSNKREEIVYTTLISVQWRARSGANTGGSVVKELSNTWKWVGVGVETSKKWFWRSPPLFHPIIIVPSNRVQ